MASDAYAPVFYGCALQPKVLSDEALDEHKKPEFVVYKDWVRRSADGELPPLGTNRFFPKSFPREHQEAMLRVMCVYLILSKFT